MADTLPCSIQRRHKVNVSPYQQPPVAGSNPATSSKKKKPPQGGFFFLPSLTGVEVYAPLVG